MSYDDEESFEHTLLVVREVSVYKIPPRSTSGGYKCGEWLQSDKIWTGRLRVVSVGELCEIRLEEANTGELFAACHVHPGKRDISVEPATDSSRYFVLRIDDGQGKHAFIGLGFTERNEAFDFNVALSDHEKHALHKDKEDAQEDTAHEPLPSMDLRLKFLLLNKLLAKTFQATTKHTREVNGNPRIESICGRELVVQCIYYRRKMGMVALLHPFCCYKIIVKVNLPGIIHGTKANFNQSSVHTIFYLCGSPM